MNRRFLSLLLVNVAVLCPNLRAQHLWWNLEGQRDATCLYGEVTIAKLAPEYGMPVYGGRGKSPDPISKSPIPPAVITALQHLPRAGKVTVPRERAGKTPIKVFILAGQSNMEGYGGINSIDELGDHPTLGGLLQKVKRADGSFITP
jgi:hypothetical protein